MCVRGGGDKTGHKEKVCETHRDRLSLLKLSLLKLIKGDVTEYFTNDRLDSSFTALDIRGWGDLMGGGQSRDSEL